MTKVLEYKIIIGKYVVIMSKRCNIIKTCYFEINELFIINLEWIVS